MQGEGILSFLASSITNKTVEYIHVSSDGFKSMIGGTVLMLIRILLLPVMLPDQFGRGLFVGAKNHVACQRRSRFASGASIFLKVRFLIGLNLTLDKLLKLDLSQSVTLTDAADRSTLLLCFKRFMTSYLSFEELIATLTRLIFAWINFHGLRGIFAYPRKFVYAKFLKLFYPRK